MFAGDRIYGIAAREDAADFLVNHALTLCLVFDRGNVFVDGLALLRCSNFLHIGAFRGEDHECNTEDCVGTRSENFKLYIAVSYLESHLCTLGAAYPVTLCLLERVGPIQTVETLQ